MEDWVQLILSKNGIWGIFQLVSILHHLWHIKLHKPTNFHAGMIFCTIVATADKAVMLF